MFFGSQRSQHPKSVFFSVESQNEAATQLKFSQRHCGNKVSKAEAIAVVFDVVL